MEKEFVPYELALRLKNLGFDEPCLNFYQVKGRFYASAIYIESQYDVKEFCDTDISCLAPTFSQAFRWFRDEYKLGVQATRDGGEWHFHIVYYGDEHKSSPQRNLTYVEKSSEDYEEVELACLDKLIEIVELDNKLK